MNTPPQRNKKKKKKKNKITKVKSHNDSDYSFQSKTHKSPNNHRRTRSSLISPTSSKSQTIFKSKSKTKPKSKSSKSSKTKHRVHFKSPPHSRGRSRKRRTSKDCLDITGISRLSTKAIELWDVSEDVECVKLIDNGKYKEYANKFRMKKIDGRKLFKMNRSMLQAIDVYHPSARKAILAALQRMKSKVKI